MAVKTKVAEDPRDLINKHLADNQRTVGWLAKQLIGTHTYINLYFIFKKQRPLTDANLAAVNKVLGTNFKPMPKVK